MTNINRAAVLNPFPELTTNILDYVPRATTTEFGIVAIGAGVKVDALGRICLDTQEISDRFDVMEAEVASAFTTQKAEIDASLVAIAGGHKAYQTLALAQAAQASLPANTIVEVTNDGANNGTYQWNGTTLTKSAYDPLTQAKDYTNNKSSTTKAEAVALANNYTDLVFDTVPAAIVPYVGQAEAAATAATISAGVFETPEAGVDPTTGVEDGEYFNVRSPSSDSYIDEYQNIGGAAVATGKSYPSGALTQAMSEQIDKIGSLGYLSEQLDQIAVDKGWDASFVVYRGISQKKLNDGLESIADMLAIVNPQDGMRVCVKSYHPVNYALAEPYFARGGGYFEYNSALVSRNDGGVVFNGWVRLDIENLNVNDFGAKGNWNARLNFGDDDTVPFEKYAAYITTYGKTPREGATRIMRVLSGSYRLKGFTLPSTVWGWSFELLGEGQMSQLWFDPTGTGIDIQQENVNFKDIVLNGKLNPTTPQVSDPAIPYIVKIKLASKTADVDFTCDNVEVHWFDHFARVAGRGFTFKGGNVGITGSGGTLCEIACDADMVVGTDPAMQDVAATMRHFKVSGTRFDFCQNIFKITGTHAVKDYINGLTVESCELMGLRTIVKSDDCRLIKPKFVNNLAIASFQSQYSLGAIVVPRAIDVLDSGNSWNYITNPNHTATGRTDGIGFIHRYTSIDGLTVIGSSSKDLIYGFIDTAGATNNIKILDSNFSGFGDIENDTSLLRCVMKPTNITIRGNTITSKTSRPRKWIRGDISGSNSIVIKDNICDKTFPPQALTYTPKLRINNADSGTASYASQVGFYWVEGDYIHVRASMALTETSSLGAMGVSLPVPAIADFLAISSYISGSGELTTLTSFNVSNSVLVDVSASTDQTAKLMLSPTTQLNLSQKTANSITIACGFKYRFK